VIEFYLEKTSTVRSSSLRGKVNSGGGLQSFTGDSGWNENYYRTNRDNVFESKADASLYTSGGDFTVNDKYNGFSGNLYTNTYHSSLTSVNPGTAVSSVSLKIYNTRNVYQLYYKGIKSDMVDAYLYGATIDSMPVINESDWNKYRPAGIGSDYRFVGWNTQSDGEGEWVVLQSDTKDRTFSYYQDAGKTYAGTTAWRAGGKAVAFKGPTNDVASATSTVRELTMPAGGMTLFAIWRNTPVTVHCFTMLTSGGAVTRDYGESVIHEFQTHIGSKIDSTLKTYKDGFGLNAQNEKTVGNRKYKFNGWKIATADQLSTAGYIDPTDLRLHFNENVSVAVSGENLYLIADWKQLSGPMPFKIVAYLFNVDTGTFDETLKFTSTELGLPDKEIGQSATVTALTGEPLDGATDAANTKMAKLKDYYPLTPQVTITNFSADNCTFDFNYELLDEWDIDIQYGVEFVDKDDATAKHYVPFERETITTINANYIATAMDPPTGYSLASTEPVKILKSDDSKAAKFKYNLTGTVVPETGPINWDLSGTKPKLYTVGVAGGEFRSSVSEYRYVTTVTYNDPTTDAVLYTETHTSRPDSYNETTKIYSHNSESVVGPTGIAPGRYNTTIKVELVKGENVVAYVYANTDGTAKAGPVVNVYNKLNIVLGKDKDNADVAINTYYYFNNGQIYTKNADGTFTALASGADIEGFAALLSDSDAAGKINKVKPDDDTNTYTFRGCAITVGSADNIILDADGKLTEYTTVGAATAAINSGTLRLHPAWQATPKTPAP
jgi:hypothetical protein